MDSLKSEPDVSCFFVVGNFSLLTYCPDAFESISASQFDVNTAKEAAHQIICTKFTGSPLL